jgi:hypothetical protein
MIQEMTLVGIGSPIKVQIIPPDLWAQHVGEIAPAEPATIRGFADYSTKTIYVEDNTQAPSTLLHELIHLTSDFCGGELTEEQVEAVERGLWAVLGQNPHLLEYWTDKT